MEGLLAALEATWWAQGLRSSRWGYAAVNTAHVLGIALLVGAVVPLDLRLLGLWRSVPQALVAQVLVPVAAAGLALAAATGIVLFCVRAPEYAGLAVLRLKLALIGIGTISALLAHWRHGAHLDDASRGRLAAHGAVSLACWIGALVCGRLIAFAGE